MQAVTPTISSKLQRLSSSGFVDSERSETGMLACTHMGEAPPGSWGCLRGSCLQSCKLPDSGPSQCSSWRPRYTSLLEIHEPTRSFDENELSRQGRAGRDVWAACVWMHCYLLVCKKSVSDCHVCSHETTHQDSFDRRSFRPTVDESSCR
jgi:hypothetical protein